MPVCSVELALSALHHTVIIAGHCACIPVGLHQQTGSPPGPGLITACTGGGSARSAAVCAALRRHAELRQRRLERSYPSSIFPIGPVVWPSWVRNRRGRLSWWLVSRAWPASRLPSVDAVRPICTCSVLRWQLYGEALSFPVQHYTLAHHPGQAAVLHLHGWAMSVPLYGGAETSAVSCGS